MLLKRIMPKWPIAGPSITHIEKVTADTCPNLKHSNQKL